MPIIAKYFDPNSSGKPAFEPASEGIHDGSIVDVQDLGLLHNKLYDKLERKIRIVVELAATNSFGKHILVSMRRTLSLHPRSLLSKDIKAITGVTPSTDLDIEAALLLCSVKVLIAHAPNAEDASRPYQHVIQIWKGDGSYSPSGTYQPWRDGSFPIGRAISSLTEKGKAYLQLYDADGNELAKIWDAPDMEAAKGAEVIRCQFRDSDDGTIRIRKDSVKREEAA